MEVNAFSVHVLRCPFGIRELHFTEHADAAAGASGLSAGDHYAHVSSGTENGNNNNNKATPPSHYAVVGTRGIQQLVATTRSAQAGKPEEVSTPPRRSTIAGTTTNLLAQVPDVFSTHDKGRLLLWDSNTGTLAAAHAFNPAFTVHQWAVAGPCLYTTLEGSPATAGAEEETCVYAWDRRTLKPVTVLRGHEGRLTALAVAPPSLSLPRDPALAADASSSDVVLATASLDGTVRLWRHRSSSSGSGSGSPRAAGTERSGEGPVQNFVVLPSTELGVIQGLRFLSADVLVAACSKCALAFVRLSSAAAAAANSSGRRNGSLISAAVVDGVGCLRWQLVRSSVDPDGSTTTLHVSPGGSTDTRKFSSSAAAASATGVMTKPSSPVGGDLRRRVYIVTGSTSGYLQEWIVDVGEGESQIPSPTSAPETEAADASTSTTTAAVTTAAGVSVRGRWQHRAHNATIDCIVTDEDIAVSTSIFDGARLYHRRAGATCVITTSAAVPVLVPQLKQLVWGSVDGSLTVASYALFASGAQRELHTLWTAKPHTAAIRGVCLSLTPGMQWRVLCVGAADGSFSVWRPPPPPALAPASTRLGKSGSPALSRVLDVYAPPPSAGAPRPALIIAGLKREGKGYVLATTTVGTETDAASPLTTLPALPQQGDEVTCARLCCGMETTNNTLLLVAGTRGGQLLLYAHDARKGAWRALEPCQWSASKALPRASVTGLSPLRAGPSGGAFLAVVAHGPANLSLATQRVLTAVLRTRLGKEGDVVVEDVASSEGVIEVSAPSQGSLTSELSSSNNNSNSGGVTEPRVDVAWMVSDAAAAAHVGAATSAAGYGVVVRDTRGMLLRCRADVDRSSHGAAPGLSWYAPEVVVKASSAPLASFPVVIPNLDAALADIVVADGKESDILCVNVASSRKQILVKAAARLAESTGLLCDVATAAVRFAAVLKGTAVSAAGVVALYDDQGQQRYRVTRDGACTVSGSSGAAPTSATKKEANFTPRSVVSSRRSSPARSLSIPFSAPTPSTACTVLAASAADRLLFIGYDDGLLQMVDTSNPFVFVRVWVRDEAGVTRGIRELLYVNGVVLVRLSSGCRRAFVVPPRSILDQPLPL